MSETESPPEISENLPAVPRLKEVVTGMTAEQRYEKFKGMLKARKYTIQALALNATKSEKNWPHISQVLRGKRKGEKTWARLADFLTCDELIVLGKENLMGVSNVSKPEEAKTDSVLERST